MPTRTPSYAVLGLTAGHGFSANPCLAGQLAWARARHVPVGAYLVPTYPTPAQRAAGATGPFGRCAVTKVPNCRLRNAGAAEAGDAIAIMHAAGIEPPIVWLDVEGRTTLPWHTARPWEDKAVLRGVIRGMRREGVRYGVYTTAYMWRVIVGGWRVRAPNWLPTGTASIHDAYRLCRTTATGGRTLQVQWTTGVDHDLVCPAFASQGRRLIAR